MASRQEKPRRPGLIEQARRLDAQRVATETKGLVRSVFEVLDLKFRNARGQANEEEVAKLEAISQQAEVLATATEAKINAAIEKQPRLRVKSALAQESNPNHSAVCEDVAVRDDRRQLYAVFDGMGSYGDGKKAAGDAARIIADELLALPDDAAIGLIATTMTTAFKQAGEVIRNAPYNVGREAGRLAGTVGVVMKIHEAADGKRTAVMAHAGDARAYVRKLNGELRALTRDHSLLKIFVETGLLDAADFATLSTRFANTIDPDRELTNSQVYFKARDFRDGQIKQWTEQMLYDAGNVVSNYVNPQEDPEITVYELEDGDQIVLTSDGIHDLVPDNHIAQAFNVLDDAQDIANRLLSNSKAKIRMGPQNKTDDDRTALVIQWEDVLAAEEREHIETYKQQINTNRPLTVPLTTVDQTAFRKLVEQDYHGLAEAFARSYNPSDEADWRAAWAGELIDTLPKKPESVDIRRQTLSHDQVVAVERKLLYEAQCLGDAAKLATVKFTEASAVLREKDILDRLNRLINLLLEKGIDLMDKDVAAEPHCQELANQLGLTVEDVVTTITTYQQVLIERAAQRERSERKFSKQLLKAGVYLAGGTALTASAIVAPPVALGIIAGTRLVDRLLSHRDQVKKQAEYLKHSLEQIKTNQVARQLALDELAASLAARKREQLTVRTNPGEIANQMLTSFRDQYCLTEYTNAQDALNNCNSGIGTYENYEQMITLYRQKFEPYRRAAHAYKALLTIDQNILALAETKTKLSTTWVEKHPKIAALLGYRNEMIGEKLSSAAFFTVAGLAAREWLPVRVALSAFAGARAGEAFMMWQEERGKGSTGQLTWGYLDKIDVTQTDTAAKMLDELESDVAGALLKLTDTKFKRQQPKQYEALYQVFARFEQLQAAVNAQRALNTMAVQLAGLKYVSEVIKIEKTDNPLARRIFAASTAMLAGVTSALLGLNLDEWLERFKVEQPPTPTGTVSWLDGIKDSIAGWFENDTSPPATPQSAPEPAPEPIDEATARPVPAEPVQPPTAAVEPPPTAEPVVEAPSPEAPVSTKVIGEGQGLSHGLAGQASRAEINRLLHDTKVTINGHEVALANTGVAESGKLEVGVGMVGGHKVVEFYDATTHQEIAADNLDDYLYEMGHAPAVVPETDEVTRIPAESPDGEGVAVEPVDVADQPGFELRAPHIGHETFGQYEQDVMRDYVRSHPDYAALQSLPDEELVDRPELRAVHEAIAQQYRTATQAEAVVQEPAAPVTTSAEAFVRGGKLTATGMKELSLAEHISTNGEPELYNTFKKEILDLLAADQRHRITTANGLVFEDRAGQLYVDVAGGGRDAYLLDEHLYKNLMTEYKTIVEPDLHGRFTREAFYTALDIANVPHDLHQFELEQINLNHFISKGEPVPYVQFQVNLTEFMTDHDLTKFVSPNGLVFYRVNNQLFVDVAGGLTHRYPLNGQLYEALMARYQDLGYDYHEKFDVTQFEYVLKQVEGKK